MTYELLEKDEGMFKWNLLHEKRERIWHKYWDDFFAHLCDDKEAAMAAKKREEKMVQKHGRTVGVSLHSAKETAREQIQSGKTAAVACCASTGCGNSRNVWNEDSEKKIREDMRMRYELVHDQVTEVGAEKIIQWHQQTHPAMFYARDKIIEELEGLDVWVEPEACIGFYIRVRVRFGLRLQLGLGLRTVCGFCAMCTTVLNTFCATVAK